MTLNDITIRVHEYREEVGGESAVLIVRGHPRLTNRLVLEIGDESHVFFISDLVNALAAVKAAKSIR